MKSGKVGILKRCQVISGQNKKWWQVFKIKSDNNYEWSKQSMVKIKLAKIKSGWNEKWSKLSGDKWSKWKVVTSGQNEKWSKIKVVKCGQKEKWELFWTYWLLHGTCWEHCMSYCVTARLMCTVYACFSISLWKATFNWPGKGLFWVWSFETKVDWIPYINSFQ